MNSDKLKPNELKVVILLLSQLEKRITLLRISLYGNLDRYDSGSNTLFSNEMMKLIENEDLESPQRLSVEDYRLMVDCCDIETGVRRILNDLMNTKSYEVLKDVVEEYEKESTSLKNHQKMIEAKQKEIEQLKQDLFHIQERSQMTAKHDNSQNVPKKEKFADKVEASDDLEFLRQLVDYKMKSEKEFYEYKEDEIQRKIQGYERESVTQAHADIQTISFWMLKYDDKSQELDKLLRQMFDIWSLKRRELQILKKYRRLNSEKITKLQKLILDRENYIEEDRKEKEIELKKRTEEIRRQTAAIKIQAFWRGTMVRKKLGPYKVKKPKKGKGKKGKGKKKK